MSTQRPPFLYPFGSPSMHAPLALTKSQMYGFWVQGDAKIMQASVDASLNQCTQGQMQFKVLTPFVLLSFTDVSHANSLYPPDQNKGWGQETDIVTWVLVGQMNAGESEISHIYFYPIHIFVNDGMALINGRELYGYPKYLCDCTMPANPDAPLQFSLSAKGFQPFAETTELALQPLLSVSGAADKPKRLIADFETWLLEMLTFLKSMPGFWNFDEAAWQQLLATLKAPQVDQIFLKQFPDGTGAAAVYQAIVTSPAQVKAIHTLHLYGETCTLQLNQFASFPLDKSLGWSLGAQPALMPFAINFDFVVQPGTELVNNSVIEREKIAILGGGVGAMTAAFCLTEQPGWQNRYEIDVYQMGWRLGGKGANGRNASLGQRIEEHGLHIWFGFYENAFAMMQSAYAELNRSASAPLAHWDDAFKQQHFITLMENIQGSWKQWPIDTPITPGTPGKGSNEITLWAAIRTGLAWIKQWLSAIRAEHLASPEHAVLDAENTKGSWLTRLAEHVQSDALKLGADVQLALAAFEQFFVGLDDVLENHPDEHHALLSDVLVGLRHWLTSVLAKHETLTDTLRRLFIMADLSISVCKGMIDDGVLKSGFEVINNVDFYQWLTDHGANPKYTVHSAPVRGFYDLIFAYENGDFNKPNIEAGTMLRGMMKVAMCYHGSIMYKMQAGMGDVVFTPLYQVLKKRGVRFHFFHKVLALEASADGKDVGAIRLQNQAQLAGADYDPLVQVKALDCWPSTPNYPQLEASQAALLQAHSINLESQWSAWPAIYAANFGTPLPEKRLLQGVDFDRVVFGLSVANLADVAADLLSKSDALNRCSQQVKAVATQAYQVWLNSDIKALGWTAFANDGQAPVLSAFSEPYDTWAPMDQLLEREDWPSDAAPKNISYFCSALPMATYPPYTDTDFPARAAGLAKQGAIVQLQGDISALWPNAVRLTGFDWSLLLDTSAARGPDRFDSQYWRANIDPSERYVLSVVNSSQYRLRADQSGFSNLTLAGDWLKTGLDAGCVEAATMGGMQAARAICGWPVVIRGESGF